jgi:hypothetical protein
MGRGKHKVSIGHGDNPELLRLIRAHGNAVETVPLALLLLALAESFATPVWVLHLLGLMLLTGRVLHGMYFLQGATVMALRGAGMLLTVAMQALAAAALIGHAVLSTGVA